ncbi:MAG: aldolase [Planctomycetaceae bacterium]|nr:aldolase [Planctomycetaceae bacterium]
MRTSKIKAKLRRNEAVLVTALHLNDPVVFEMASLYGFDGLWLDMEHQARSVETASQLIRAARVGTSDVMTRCAKGEFLRLGRMLEIGATGIMYPRCDDAAEAREVVRWAKFAPLGNRGIDSAGADNPYCTMPMVDYLKAANDETFIVIQVEDDGALSNVEEIAKVDGVDVIFFGPGDYSILGGFPGQWDHPKIGAAMERIAAAAKSAGKHWGMPVLNDVAFAKKVYDMGGRFMANGADQQMIRAGFEDLQKRFGPVGLAFERRV